MSRVDRGRIMHGGRAMRYEREVYFYLCDLSHLRVHMPHTRPQPPPPQRQRSPHDTRQQKRYGTRHNTRASRLQATYACAPPSPAPYPTQTRSRLDRPDTHPYGAARKHANHLTQPCAESCRRCAHSFYSSATRPPLVLGDDAASPSSSGAPCSARSAASLTSP